jgi:hypothetical protein
MFCGRVVGTNSEPVYDKLVRYCAGVAQQHRDTGGGCVSLSWKILSLVQICRELLHPRRSVISASC